MSGLQRFEDWPERLHAFVAARSATPFAWGMHDCCIFAADAVLAVTGQDPGAPWRGYSTARVAVRRMREPGLPAIASAALGEPIAAPLAWRGDVVAVRLGKRIALGVCLGDVATVAATPTGVAMVPMIAATAAWRV
jgi:hypothetical protein